MYGKEQYGGWQDAAPLEMQERAWQEAVWRNPVRMLSIPWATPGETRLREGLVRAGIKTMEDIEREIPKKGFIFDIDIAYDTEGNYDFHFAFIPFRIVTYTYNIHWCASLLHTIYACSTLSNKCSMYMCMHVPM